MDSYDFMMQTQRDSYKYSSLEADEPPIHPRHRQRDVSVGKDNKPGHPIADIRRTLGLDEPSKILGESTEEWALRMINQPEKG